MTVYVVVLQKNVGVVCGVFSTSEKAAQYISDRPYNGYVLSEHTVDSGE